MLYPIVCAAVSVVFVANAVAELIPISANRVISARLSGISYFEGVYIPWQNGPHVVTGSGFDPFDSTVTAAGGGNYLTVSQYSVFAPTEWTLFGQTLPFMQYGPPHGQPADGVAFSELDVSFVATAGTMIQFTGATQGWARFTVSSNGSIILQDDGSTQLTVLQDTSFSVFATTRRNYHGFAYDEENFSLTITSTPAPSSVGVLALAAAGCFARRRRAI